MKKRFVYGIILMLSLLAVAVLSGCGGCDGCLYACGSCAGGCSSCVFDCGESACDGCVDCIHPFFEGFN